MPSVTEELLAHFDLGRDLSTRGERLEPVAVPRLAIWMSDTSLWIAQRIGMHGSYAGTDLHIFGGQPADGGHRGVFNLEPNDRERVW